MVRLPFKKYKLLVALLIVFYLLFSGLHIAQAFLFKDLFDAVSQNGFDLLPTLLIKIGCFAASLAITVYLLYVLNAEFLKRCSRDLKNAVIDKITIMDFNSFTANNSAKYVSIINNDVKILETDYYNNILAILSGIFTSVFGIITLIYFSPILAAVTIVLGLFPLLIPILLKKRLENRQKGYVEALERYNAYIRDIFSGFEALVSFGAGRHVRKSHAEENSSAGESNLRLKKLKAKSTAFSGGTFMLIMVVDFLAAATLVITKRITLGTMMGATQTMNYVIRPIQRSMEGYSTLTAARAVVSRVENLLAEEEHHELAKVKTMSPSLMARAIQWW